MKTIPLLAVSVTWASALLGATPVAVTLDATGKVSACTGATVGEVSVARDEHKQLSIAFDFKPIEKGPATITVQGLSPMNWIRHEDKLMLCKYT